MKKVYELPVIEVVELEVNDVLTESNNADVAWWEAMQ